MDKGGATRGADTVDVQRMMELCERHGVSAAAVEQALTVQARAHSHTTGFVRAHTPPVMFD